MRQCMNCMRCGRCIEDVRECDPKCPGIPNEKLEDYETLVPDALPLETILGGRYVVGRALSMTDYSAIYLCWDIMLRRRVAIREYFPFSCCDRGNDKVKVIIKDGKTELFNKGCNAFLEEAAALNRAQDIKGIVNIYSMFKENATAYYVMEYIEGETLQDYLDKMNMLSPITARNYFLKLTDIVEKLHDRGILHLNIAPVNIFIDQDDNLKLTDFGAAKVALMREGKRTVGNLLEDGYCAPELQMWENGSVRSDLYSIGAVYYRMLTGSKLSGSKETTLRRLKNHCSDVSAINIIRLLVVKKPVRRPENLEQLLRYANVKYR